MLHMERSYLPRKEFSIASHQQPDTPKRGSNLTVVPSHRHVHLIKIRLFVAVDNFIVGIIRYIVSVTI